MASRKHSSSIAAALWGALAIGALAAPALAGSARIMDRPDAGEFATIQSAVDAALDGETILVGAGSYAGFTMGDKSLSVVAEPQVTITNTVTVQGLASARRVLLLGLKIAPSGVSFGYSGRPGLVLSSCAGHVRIQSCNVTGGITEAVYGQVYVAGPAVEVTSCPQVAFVSCPLTGKAPGYLSGLDPAAGGDGIHSIDSAIALYDCVVLGGTGSEESNPAGGRGGNGISMQSWGLVASGTTIRGGRGGGGDYIGCTTSGDGGDGLVLVNAQAHLLDTTPEAGVGSSRVDLQACKLEYSIVSPK